MSRKSNTPANADIFPHTGTIFIDHSRYVHNKIKTEGKKFAKSMLLIIAILFLSVYWGYFGAAPTTQEDQAIMGFYKIMAWVMLGALPFKLFGLQPYFKLKTVARTSPLMRISNEGISWWEKPELNISWQQIGVFVLKQSKIYALPRIAIFQPEKPHMPLICIDTALLDVKRKDMLAYLEARLLVEHKNPMKLAEENTAEL